MKMSENINEFATAFSKAQAMMSSAYKDAKNNFFKSNYATFGSIIEAIRVPFEKNGLSYLQPCRIIHSDNLHSLQPIITELRLKYTGEKKSEADFEKIMNLLSAIGSTTIVVETIIMHSSGQWISGEVSSKPVKNDPQGNGSLITYLKRYSLQVMVGVVTDDDDDGEAAMGRPKQQQQHYQREETTMEKITAKIRQYTSNFADKEKLNYIKQVINVTSQELESSTEEEKKQVLAAINAHIELENRK